MWGCAAHVWGKMAARPWRGVLPALLVMVGLFGLIVFGVLALWVKMDDKLVATVIAAVVLFTMAPDRVELPPGVRSEACSFRQSCFIAARRWQGRRSSFSTRSRDARVIQLSRPAACPKGCFARSRLCCEND